MRNLFLILCLTTYFHAYGQSLAHEYALLNEKLKSEDYSVEKVRDMNARLKEMEKAGTYPVLQYDTASSDITYRYVMDFPGIPKSILYKRVKEWCALKYGDFETVLRYEDFETGKVIVKGYVEIPYEFTWAEMFGGAMMSANKTKCTHALVATVKDFKLKIELREVAYDIEYGGYMFGSTYYPKVSYTKSIQSFIPLVNVKLRDWKTTLTLLKNTDIQFRYMKNSLEKYLLDYLNDYKF